MHGILGGLAIVVLCAVGAAVATGLAYMFARGIVAIIPNKEEGEEP